MKIDMDILYISDRQTDIYIYTYIHTHINRLIDRYFDAAARPLCLVVSLLVQCWFSV